MQNDNENSRLPPLNLLILRSAQGMIIVTSLMIIFAALGRALLHNDAHFERLVSLSIFYGSIFVLPPFFAATICTIYKYSWNKLICMQNPVIGVIFGLALLFVVMLLTALVGHYVSGDKAPYDAFYVYREMVLGSVLFLGFWFAVFGLSLFVRDICYSRERPCGRRWFLVRCQALFLCLATTMPCFCCMPPVPEEDGIDIMDIDFNALENGGLVAAEEDDAAQPAAAAQDNNEEGRIIGNVHADNAQEVERIMV
jgi:hypothetical protein